MFRYLINLYRYSSIYVIQLKSFKTYFYPSRLSYNSSLLSRQHSSITEQTMANCNVFIGKEDNYKGIHIDSSKEFCEDGVSFTSKLEASLKKWVADKVRGVWFKVALEHAEWVPELAKNGFRFHRADGDAVHMYRWLPENEEPRIPLYAHTMVGVGGIVINSKDELLVVQERYKNMPYWKLPGGYVEPGENISTAGIREVLEETNITTVFKSLIAFRHSHQAAFGCSDFYFIVELQPITDHIIKEDKEIEDCQWMNIDTFLSHPNVHENNRLFVRQYLSNKALGVEIQGQQTFHPVTNMPQTLFCVTNIPSLSTTTGDNILQ